MYITEGLCIVTIRLNGNAYAIGMRRQRNVIIVFVIISIITQFPNY